MDLISNTMYLYAWLTVCLLSVPCFCISVHTFLKQLFMLPLIWMVSFCKQKICTVCGRGFCPDSQSSVSDEHIRNTFHHWHCKGARTETETVHWEQSEGWVFGSLLHIHYYWYPLFKTLSLFNVTMHLVYAYIWKHKESIIGPILNLCLNHLSGCEKHRAHKCLYPACAPHPDGQPSEGF